MQPTPVTLGALRAIAGRYRLRPPAGVPRPWLGATSAVYPLGSAVLKVPHASPAAVEAAAVVHDATAEARILWCHLQFALHTLRSHPAAPGEHRRRTARLVRRMREYLTATRLA